MNRTIRTFTLLSLIFLSCIPAWAAADGERRCGSEFAAYGLEGATFSEALDRAGQIHNEYQESLLSQLVDERVDLRDADALKSVIEKKSIEYFAERGLYFTDQYPFSGSFEVGTAEIRFSADSYSAEGAEILSRLHELVLAYDVNEDAEFFDQLNGLRDAALNLPEEQEVFTVGVPVSVAIHSFSYWKANADRWARALGQPPSGVEVQAVKIGYGQLGAADIGGAIEGGFGGTVLGPGGAAAGAILGASTASLFNLAGQILSHYVSWW
jgi:hypothetical protein